MTTQRLALCDQLDVVLWCRPRTALTSLRAFVVVIGGRGLVVCSDGEPARLLLPGEWLQVATHAQALPTVPASLVDALTVLGHVEAADDGERRASPRLAA